MDQKPSFEDVETIQWVRDGQTMDQKPSFEEYRRMGMRRTIQWENTMGKRRTNNVQKIRTDKPSFKEVQTIRRTNNGSVQLIRNRHSKTTDNTMGMRRTNNGSEAVIRRRTDNTMGMRRTNNDQKPSFEEVQTIQWV